MSKYQVINPYTDKVFTDYTFEEYTSVAQKIQMLKLGQRELKQLNTFKRAEILNNLANLIEKNQKKLIDLIISEVGKTYQDAKVEITRGVSTIRVSATECSQLHGEVIHSDHFGMEQNKRGLVEWKPMGTLLAITPFNFPLNLAVHKIGPAFAVGNTILFKPHPQNYLSGLLLVELCYQAGMTKNMIQMTMPTNEVMGEVVAHKDINLISLTGGTVAADAIAKTAGMKKLLFELGGNDPLIVCSDGNIDKAISACINQRFATAGQRCTAAKRIYIHDSIYNDFKTKLLAKTKELKVGDPSLEETFVGPVISSAAADVVMDRIKMAVSDGAILLAGGTREGNIIFPTILENVSSESELIAKETFGPVLPLRSFKDINEVIEDVNSSDFGLQSGVFTKNLETIKKLFDELEVGALIVDDGPGFRAEHFPFGGVKQSGIGSEGVRYTMLEMAHRKTLVF